MQEKSHASKLNRCGYADAMRDWFWRSGLVLEIGSGSWGAVLVPGEWFWFWGVVGLLVPGEPYWQLGIGSDSWGAVLGAGDRFGFLGSGTRS